MKKTLLFGSVLIAMMAIIAACKHHPEFQDVILDNGGNGGTVNPPDTIIYVNPHPCDPDTVYFSTTILPMLNQMCAVEECHDAITHEDDVELYDYQNIMNVVTAFDLGDSDLWEAINAKGDDQMPPADSPQLSAEQMQQIQTWMLQGAKNNFCQQDCDTSQYLFDHDIKPIITTYCSQGCHGGTSPSGDLSLETYLEIETVALDGRLMNSLHGTNDVSLMPDNTTGLPECFITQIQNWVNSGAPNN